MFRDIRRAIAGQQALEQAFILPLGRATQIHSQQQRQRGWKLYSFRAPNVECIGKGKAVSPYEFGVKTSITSPPVALIAAVVHAPERYRTHSL